MYIIHIFRMAEIKAAGSGIYKMGRIKND